MAEIRRVLLGRQPLALRRSGEGLGHARVVGVDDHDVDAVAGCHAAENRRSELMARPELISSDDDPHARILSGMWTFEQKIQRSHPVACPQLLRTPHPRHLAGGWLTWMISARCRRRARICSAIPRTHVLRSSVFRTISRLPS